MISAGLVPGVGVPDALAASFFVAGSQVGGVDNGVLRVRRWRVRTCGMVDGVFIVAAKNPSSPLGFTRRESVGIGV